MILCLAQSLPSGYLSLLARCLGLGFDAARGCTCLIGFVLAGVVGVCVTLANRVVSAGSCGPECVWHLAVGCTSSMCVCAWLSQRHTNGWLEGLRSARPQAPDAAAHVVCVPASENWRLLYLAAAQAAGCRVTPEAARVGSGSGPRPRGTGLS
jgi:hypothetical protein